MSDIDNASIRETIATSPGLPMRGVSSLEMAQAQSGIGWIPGTSYRDIASRQIPHRIGQICELSVKKVEIDRPNSIYFYPGELDSRSLRGITRNISDPDAVTIICDHSKAYNSRAWRRAIWPETSCLVRISSHLVNASGYSTCAPVSPALRA